MINSIYVDNIIKTALLEDINYLDVTTDYLIDEEQENTARFLAKDDGILCGIDIALRVFRILQPEGFEATVYKKDGDELQKYGRKPLGLEPAHRPITGKKMPSGFRSQIRAILQDTYFVLPKPEKYDESYKRVEEIIKQLFGEYYEISSDLVEAKSIAVVASIILDEVREGQA